MSQFLIKYHIEITYIICAILGGIMNWIKKTMQGETDARLSEWYGRSNLAATVYTVTIFFFAIVGTLAADIINTQTGFWAAMYTGFVTGFAIDSGFNRDMRDVHKDMVRNKASMNDFFNKDPNNDYDRVGSYSVSHYGRDESSYYASDDSDIDQRKPTRSLTVEERRAQLRKKLKGY